MEEEPLQKDNDGKEEIRIRYNLPRYGTIEFYRMAVIDELIEYFALFDSRDLEFLFDFTEII